MRDVSGTDPVEIVIPYRNTLKKVQTHWVGTLAEGIEGSPGLVAQQSMDLDVRGKTMKVGVIEGHLANKTGRDLRNVMLAFRFQEPDGNDVVDQDIALYVPSWKKDQPLDLLRTYAEAEILTDIGPSKSYDRYVAGTAATPIRAPLSGPNSWGEYWLRQMKLLAGSDFLVDDSGRAMTQSVPLMSFFDRLPPMKNNPYLSGYQRAELFRRGGRQLNLSHALAAGNLVIVAEVDNAPLPVPFEVEGSRMKGEGRIYYQATVPIKNRAALMEPYTNPPPPTTAPATTEPAASPAAPAAPPPDQAVEPVVQ
jgi:hypothetical protein